MVDLCEPRDLWDHGLPRGAVANAGRRVALVDPVADAFTLGEHCLFDGDLVRLRADANGTMPAGLVAGMSYYIKRIDDARFQLAASSGGAAIDITTAGSNVIVVVPINYEAVCAWASGIVYDMVPAHAVPFVDPVPPVMRATAAELAAWKVMQITGSGQPASLLAMLEAVQKRVARWATGVPIRDENATEPANLSAGAPAASAPYEDRRGWSRYGGL